MTDSDIWAGKSVDAGRRITRLLQTDIDAFVMSEIRRRFVEAPALADGLDDKALAGLKARAKALAAGRREAIGEALAAERIWLDAQPSDSDDDVTAIPKVAQALTGLEEALARFLSEEGFPADEPVAYRLPRRFIDGEDLTTLTRALWKSAGYYQAAQASRAEEKQAASVESRAQRWDDA